MVRSLVLVALVAACTGGDRDNTGVAGATGTAGGIDAAGTGAAAGRSGAAGGDAGKAANVAGGSADVAGRTAGGASAGGSAESAGGSAESAAGVGGTTGGVPDDLGTPAFEHEFEPLALAAGEERSDLCQSWTLGNAEPLLVNTVRSHNQGAVHHSNWIWVPDDQYPGPDGTWPCTERGFDQVVAGAIGGVFFAQSTQSRVDQQRFPEGIAFRMPAHVRIIGDVHALNVSGAALTTSIGFEVFTIAERDLRVALQPMAYTNLALDIAPGTTTHARMQCAVPGPDFDIYYVLPHFHGLGLAMSLDVQGGPLDGKEIWRSKGAYGEPLGEMMDPPLAVTGVQGLGITCEYQNASERSIGYGLGDQEMCVVLIYGNGAKAGGTALANLSVADDGGVHRTDGLCLAVGTP